jgi:hypothetical protein
MGLTCLFSQKVALSIHWQDGFGPAIASLFKAFFIQMGHCMQSA